MSVRRESEDLPEKPELDTQLQQVETATSAEDADFKRREARVVAKLDLYILPDPHRAAADILPGQRKYWVRGDPGDDRRPKSRRHAA